VPDHLPDHLGRSAIVRFRTAFLALQSQCAPFSVSGAELKVTLLAVAELASRTKRAVCFAFPFYEHHQLPCDLVVLADVQEPARPDHRVILRIELCHFCFLRKGSRWLGPPGHEPSAAMVAEMAQTVYLNMAVSWPEDIDIYRIFVNHFHRMSYDYRHSLLDDRRAGRPPGVARMRDVVRMRANQQTPENRWGAALISAWARG